jgi:hypothetical protein
MLHWNASSAEPIESEEAQDFLGMLQNESPLGVEVLGQLCDELFAHEFFLEVVWVVVWLKKAIVVAL